MLLPLQVFSLSSQSEPSLSSLSSETTSANCRPIAQATRRAMLNDPEVEHKAALSQVHDGSHGSLQGSEKDADHLGTADGNNTVDANYQAGVQAVEAVTLSWTTASLITAYILIWLVYFIQGLVAGVSGALIPYVTSSFAFHSLTPGYSFFDDCSTVLIWKLSLPHVSKGCALDACMQRLERRTQAHHWRSLYYM